MSGQPHLYTGNISDHSNPGNRIIALVPIRTNHASVQSSGVPCGGHPSRQLGISCGQRYKPFIELFAATAFQASGAKVQKEAPGDKEVITCTAKFGRKEILRAYHSTCPYRGRIINAVGSSDETTTNDTRAETSNSDRKQRTYCDQCQSIWEWGRTSLSRSMIQITRQIACNHTNGDCEDPQILKSVTEEQYQIHVHGTNAFLICLGDLPVAQMEPKELPPPPDLDSSWRGGMIVNPVANSSILTIGSDLAFQFREIDIGLFDSENEGFQLKEGKQREVADIPRTPVEAAVIGLSAGVATENAHEKIDTEVAKVEDQGKDENLDPASEYRQHQNQDRLTLFSLPSAVAVGEMTATDSNVQTSSRIGVQEEKRMEDCQCDAGTNTETETGLLDGLDEAILTNPDSTIQGAEDCAHELPGSPCEGLPKKLSASSDEQGEEVVAPQASSFHGYDANETLSERQEIPGQPEGAEVKPQSNHVRLQADDDPTQLIDLAESPPELLQRHHDQKCADSTFSTVLTSTHLPVSPERNFVILMLPLGKSLPRRRIEMMRKKLLHIPNVTVVPERRTIIDTFRANASDRETKITHLVIDENVSGEEVAAYFGLKSKEELEREFREEGIVAVKPDWIVKLADALLTEPTLNQMWPEITLKKHKVDSIAGQDSGWIKRLKQETDFGTINVIKASEAENSIISRMREKRKAELDEKIPADSSCEGGTALYRKPRRNRKLADMFDQLSNLHRDMPLDDTDAWKAYTFAVIACRLRHLDFEVCRDPSVLKRLEKIHGFGKSVMQKVKEYFETGTCERIREFNRDRTRIAIRDMLNIWGVGRVKARELVDLGYCDISQVRQGLRDGKLSLSRNAILGVKYYEDLKEKMNRSEVSAIRDVVHDTCIRKFPNCELTATGSFRRGEANCGDVDIIIVDRAYQESTPKGALWWLVDTLMSEGRIAHHLTNWNRIDEGSIHTEQIENFDSRSSARHIAEDAGSFIGKQSGSQSYMGIFISPIFPGKKRRIDIKFYPYEERAFAFLYFTGNTLFNRSMRQYATKQKRMRLSNRDLRPILRAVDDKLVCGGNDDFVGPPVKAATEEDVFDILGLVYREPTERDGFDAVIPKGDKEREFMSHLHIT